MYLEKHTKREVNKKYIFLNVYLPLFVFYS